MPSATARDFQRVCRNLGGQPEATRHGYTLTGERLQSQSTAGAKSDHLAFFKILRQLGISLEEFESYR